MLICSCKYSFARTKVYHCNVINNRINIILSEKKFYITSYYPTHHDGVTTILSYGNVVIQNDKIILIDDSLLITKLIARKDSSLIVINCFAGLIGKVFKFDYIIPTINEEKLIPKCSSVYYDNTSNPIQKLAGKTYVNHPNISFTQYKIRFDKKYYYFTFKEITLVKGSWRKKGNDLFLFNNNTGFNYHFKIIGKSLQPIKFFYTDYCGFYLFET